MSGEGTRKINRKREYRSRCRAAGLGRPAGADARCSQKGAAKQEALFPFRSVLPVGSHTIFGAGPFSSPVWVNGPFRL
jgi:hypothetical protein